MESYKIDFIDNDVSTTRVSQPFDYREGMSFILPNETHIFLTHNFIHEMKERIEDLVSDYEEQDVTGFLPRYYEYVPPARR
jgi:hypothetical protein